MKWLLLVIRPFAYLFYRMPFFVHQAVAWFIAILWFDFLRIRRKEAIENVLRVFPKKSRGEARIMARRSLYHMGLTMTEFICLPFLWKKEFDEMFQLEGAEHLEAAIKLNKGVFGLSLHLGNGDLAVAALSSWGYPTHIISKVFKSQWLNQLWFGSRKAKGVQFIAPRKSSYEILKALKAKELVFFVLDQYTGPPNGILTHFFGHKTGTAQGLALFAKRSQAPVLLMYTMRTAPFRHKIVVSEPIPIVEADSKEESLRLTTEAYNRAVEQAILQSPEQWMWVHRRWKIGFEEQLKET